MSNPTLHQSNEPAMPASLPTQRRLHPLVGAAAVAIVIASLTAVAAMTGVLPTSKATQGSQQSLTAPVAANGTVNGTINGADTAQLPAPGSTTRPPEAANLAQAPVAPAAPTPAARRAQERSSASRDAGYGPAASRNDNGAYAERQPAQGSAYAGRVVAITPIEAPKPASGLGAVGGAVIGGLLGNQIGKGNGRILGTVAGAVGGGFAGNQIEKTVRKDTSYQVRVQMDNGNYRTFTYHADPGVQVGQRVRLQDGVLVTA
ncbi:glycine zipper 2TM domain-containing protein [Cupriavidus basilensis]|uniref:glycine zipper 2TM domain-containing protein n=1 Tax=Cupriavidus basilensis TaxID=68895 RepID=UPI00157B12A5|nr:glycine zipper 2TM domain-containing protein [Cupriavidus basilensis]NUA25651.1 glycine zipper 2TM domain-containing protein [Cupriavidus basilensis]